MGYGCLVVDHGLSPPPCGVVWYGMVWYDIVWFGMAWYDIVWYGKMQFAKCGSVWHVYDGAQFIVFTCVIERWVTCNGDQSCYKLSTCFSMDVKAIINNQSRQCLKVHSPLGCFH